jgi:hypothetical protein
MRNFIVLILLTTEILMLACTDNKTQNKSDEIISGDTILNKLQYNGSSLFFFCH